MKKSWKKPAMCQVAAGFEITRYLPAEVTPKR
ncbi:pyrroloquinoline quinone precursor peptide PqqA [Mesorhizobium koreense]|jgi:coenzyme PQQ precursor peptide PqqA|nr:pyrroloquinoline quinone precursor peptide PqqA [Mesorhizobium sp. WR6]